MFKRRLELFFIFMVFFFLFSTPWIPLKQVNAILERNSAPHDFKIARQVSPLIPTWTTGACMNTQRGKADYHGNKRGSNDLRRCKDEKNKLERGS